MEENTLLPTDIETYILDCNRLAMDLLNSNQLKKSLSLLRKAETVLKTSNEKLYDSFSRFKLLAITYNNLACFYKRKKQLNTAYKYLQQALKLDLQSSNDSSIAATYLNLCAILSSMARHEEAKLHAEQAVNILESAGDVTVVEDDADRREAFQRSVTLVIGLHNLGAELEHLQRFQDAIMAFEKGLMYARKKLGSTHQLTKSLEDVLKHASNRYLNVVSLRSEREAYRNKSFVSPGRYNAVRDSDIKKQIVRLSQGNSKLPSITPPKTRGTAMSEERYNHRSHNSFTITEASRRSPNLLSRKFNNSRSIDKRAGADLM